MCDATAAVHAALLLQRSPPQICALLLRSLALTSSHFLNAMPKRATHTFESEKDGLKDADLNVFYCLCCGESVLILGSGVS